MTAFDLQQELLDQLGIVELGYRFPGQPDQAYPLNFIAILLMTNLKGNSYLCRPTNKATSIGPTSFIQAPRGSRLPA